MILTTLATANPYTITVDWSAATRRVTTAATVEVDVMPHLGRTPDGGSFTGFEQAISNLGAKYVRYSPWYAYPKVVTPELQPADCSANGKGSSWNSSMLDDIIADFMLAVCGPRAADGACDGGLSVVPQLSTIPDWMYESDGTNRSALMPSDPWVYPSGNFEYYVVQGKPLVDPTCEVMAKYAARYVGWYTAGGFVDECGIEHKSNLHYDWFGLSVLNEDEYHTPPGGENARCLPWSAHVYSDSQQTPLIEGRFDVPSRVQTGCSTRCAGTRGRGRSAR